ncbi:hypothetical protein ACFB49_39860 [Sphingomonas sp. DBB INV C78]
MVIIAQPASSAATAISGKAGTGAKAADRTNFIWALPRALVVRQVHTASRGGKASTGDPWPDRGVLAVSPQARWRDRRLIQAFPSPISPAKGAGTLALQHKGNSP